MVSYHKRNDAEPCNTCDQRTFLTILSTCRPKINKRGVGIRISWEENFKKLISGGTSIRHPRVATKNKRPI